MTAPNLHFLEKCQVDIAFAPVNMGTGANTGKWVSLEEYYRCAIILVAGAGGSAQPPTITVQQALDTSGSSAKALNFTRGDYKEATALIPKVFTSETFAAANTFSVSGSGGLQKIWVIDIMAEDLDSNGGFVAIQASVGDVGSTSQLGTVIYVRHDPKDMVDSDTNPGFVQLPA